MPSAPKHATPQTTTSEPTTHQPKEVSKEESKGETTALKDDTPSLESLLQDQKIALDYFSDIRPYDDQEIPAAMQRIMRNQTFVRDVANFLIPKAPLWIKKYLLSPLVRLIIFFTLHPIKTRIDFHLREKRPVEWAVKRSSTVSGTMHTSIQKDEARLFISNHRDIASDPTFVLYGLWKFGGYLANLPFMATGNNLFQVPYVSHLMRANGSFVVQRSFGSRRDAFKRLQKLSLYIRYLIASGRSTWLAQRQGRAKDGNDQTDRSVIGMIAASHGQKPLNEVVNALNITPVSISYEYDPCDVFKARELMQMHQKGRYKKSPGEDMKSIAKGLFDKKGHVHVSYGASIMVDASITKEALSALIDQKIFEGYRMMPTHLAAYQYLCSLAQKPMHTKAQSAIESHGQKAIKQSFETLSARAKSLAPLGKIFLMQNYAYLVFNHLGDTMPSLQTLEQAFIDT